MKITFRVSGLLVTGFLSMAGIAQADGLRPTPLPTPLPTLVPHPIHPITDNTLICKVGAVSSVGSGTSFNMGFALGADGHLSAGPLAIHAQAATVAAGDQGQNLQKGQCGWEKAALATQANTWIYIYDEGAAQRGVNFAATRVFNSGGAPGSSIPADNWQMVPDFYGGLQDGAVFSVEAQAQDGGYKTLVNTQPTLISN